MAYTHDIFISYRRNPETLAWIQDHFAPLLSLRVEFELQRAPSIYIDEQAETGASWTAAIGAALGASRMLIALWTGNYLASVWCTEELSHMLAREREARLRTAQRPHGVIVPAFIHDGETFPPALAHIKPFAIQQCFNPRMERTGKRAEELAASLATHARAIASSINNAPPWRKKWPDRAARAFYRRFYRRAEALQTRVPRFTAKK